MKDEPRLHDEPGRGVAIDEKPSPWAHKEDKDGPHHMIPVFPGA